MPRLRLAFSVSVTLLRSLALLTVLFGATSAPSMADGKRVELTLSLPRAGCAAVNPSVVNISLWFADDSRSAEKPDVDEFHTLANVVHLTVPPGYYRLAYSTRHCLPTFEWFVLLAGQPREVDVTFSNSIAREDSLYDIIYFSGGAVAGSLGPGITRVTLVPTGRPNRRTDWKTATIENGAYYFDNVFGGPYLLQGFGPTGSTTLKVAVVKNTAKIVDLKL